MPKIHHPINTLWSILSLSSVIIVAYTLYLPAINSSFTLDDIINLRGLDQVQDLPSAIQFIANGFAGPLGRPISLASFIINVPDWPGNPAGFKTINIAIHLINGLLLAQMALQIARLMPKRITHPEGFALSVAALWLLHPLLASTSLMTIQRMTSLSATFVLLGIVVYLYGRRVYCNKPHSGLLWMSIGVSIGTLLSTLCKENGALTPLYVLILEYTLLRPCKLVHQDKRINRWTAVFLVFPLLLLSGYFIIHWQNIAQGYAIRPFTLPERLLTESRILLDYLHNILFPSRSGLSPFHDDYPISKSLLNPISTLISFFIWIMLIMASWYMRRRTPILTFAIAWFLGGHSMESTFLSLELYFEHRNYLPSIGPLFALCYYPWTVQDKLRKPLLISLTLYAALLAFLLHETALTWQHPEVAAKLWVKEHPHSPRAYQYLSQQYVKQGDQIKATEIIQQGYQNNPSDSGLALEVLQMQCSIDKLQRNTIDHILNNLPDAKLSHAVPDTLKKLFNFYRDQSCSELTQADLHKLGNTLLKNPHFQASAISLANLHVFLAELFIHEGRLDPTIRHLDTAFSINPVLSTALLSSGLLASAGLYQNALQHLDHATQNMPKNPIKKAHWRKEINLLRQTIRRNIAP